MSDYAMSDYLSGFNWCDCYFPERAMGRLTMTVIDDDALPCEEWWRSCARCKGVIVGMTDLPALRTGNALTNGEITMLGGYALSERVSAPPLTAETFMDAVKAIENG